MAAKDLVESKDVEILLEGEYAYEILEGSITSITPIIGPTNGSE